MVDRQEQLITSVRTARGLVAMYEREIERRKALLTEPMPEGMRKHQEVRIKQDESSLRTWGDLLAHREKELGEVQS